LEKSQNTFTQKASSLFFSTEWSSFLKIGSSILSLASQGVEVLLPGRSERRSCNRFLILGPGFVSPRAQYAGDPPLSFSPEMN